MKRRFQCNKRDCGRLCILEVESIEEALDIVPLYCSFRLDKSKWKEV